VDHIAASMGAPAAPEAHGGSILGAPAHHHTLAQTTDRAASPPLARAHHPTAAQLGGSDDAAMPCLLVGGLPVRPPPPLAQLRPAEGAGQPAAGGAGPVGTTPGAAVSCSQDMYSQAFEEAVSRSAEQLLFPPAPVEVGAGGREQRHQQQQQHLPSLPHSSATSAVVVSEELVSPGAAVSHSAAGRASDCEGSATGVSSGGEQCVGTSSSSSVAGSEGLLLGGAQGQGMDRSGSRRRRREMLQQRRRGVGAGAGAAAVPAWAAGGPATPLTAIRASATGETMKCFHDVSGELWVD
jgi:hypothetical protein